MGDITAPPSGGDFDILWVFLIPAIIIVLSIAIIAYIVEKRKKALLMQKRKPIIFINQANNDITLLASEPVDEVIIKLSLFNKNNELVKELKIKELNLKNEEQRVIANVNQFGDNKVNYEIIDYKFGEQ